MSCPASTCHRLFPRGDYDLALTLASGQAFRWQAVGIDTWEGVVEGKWVRLKQAGHAIVAETAVPQSNWRWLERYLQIDADLAAIIAAFPPDPPLQQAVAACRGLRLLRQEPWECLASFILSSVKQIPQIQQMVERLSRQLGEPVGVPAGHPQAFAFPAAQTLAACSEITLRQAKLGFRARYLQAAARQVCSGQLDLNGLNHIPFEKARGRLESLPGVGPKIADCVLLFAYDFPQAFPVDVWVQRALGELYFNGRSLSPKHLCRWASSHFGPWAGYAQQYLFHYRRMRNNHLGTDSRPFQNAGQRKEKRRP